MFKNVANQKLIVFAFDSTTNIPKTGDAANITAYVSKDYGAVTVLGDTSATEMDSTNAKGYYLFDLTQSETNANCLMFSAKSATSNIVVLGAPSIIFTDPANYSTLSVDSSGRIDLGSILGTASTGTAGYVGPDWGHVNAPTSTVSLSGTTVGIVTTTTNLTNAPTAGDFTSTMKTSIGTAVAASAVASVTGNVTGSVGSVVGLTASNLDASVSSIKTQTDKMAFTVANKIDSNITYVNGHAVTGDGHTGTEWGPA